MFFITYIGRYQDGCVYGPFDAEAEAHAYLRSKGFVPGRDHALGAWTDWRNENTYTSAVVLRLRNP